MFPPPPFVLCVLAAASQVPTGPALTVGTGSSDPAGAERLTVQLSDTGPIELRALARTQRANGGSAWIGRGADGATGTFVFGSSAEDAALQRGLVRSAGRAWLLTPDADGVLRDHELPAIAPASCGADARCAIGTPGGRGGSRGSRGSRDNGAAPFPSGAGVQTVIDVLVVYTPAAQAGEGGPAAIEALIELACAEANLCYAQSGLDLVARVVHTAETAYVESGNHFLDMQRLQAKQDGVMDEVHPLRNTYGADCVMLVTDTLNTCGNGYLWNDPPNPQFKAFAFSVVSRHCAAAFLSFAHELGHNMGCDHDLASATPGGGAYGYSRGFLSPSGGWRSVMGLSNAPRIPRFSDPAATYMGEPLGVPQGQPGAADNVQTLAQVAPLVATFRLPKPQVIGSGMTTSVGTAVALAASGSNALGQANFGLVLNGGVPGQPAIAFLGFGPAAIPFFGGTLLVDPPLQRLPARTIDAFGFGTWTSAALPAFVASQEVYFQVWTGDPGNPAGAGVALSNAVRVEFY